MQVLANAGSLPQLSRASHRGSNKIPMRTWSFVVLHCVLWAELPRCRHRGLFSLSDSGCLIDTRQKHCILGTVTCATSKSQEPRQRNLSMDGSNHHERSPMLILLLSFKTLDPPGLLHTFEVLVHPGATSSCISS